MFLTAEDVRLPLDTLQFVEATTTAPPAAAAAAADAWHLTTVQCAGDGGGVWTESSARREQDDPALTHTTPPALDPRNPTGLEVNMRTLLALAIIATVLSTGSAIKCYVCNSHTNETCKDLSSPKAKDLLMECGDLVGGEKYTFCRKLDMYLDMDFGKHHPAENRVHRACGWERNPKVTEDCYYKSGYNTRTWVCSCTDDGCNSASLPFAGAIVLPLVAIVAVLRGAY
ncbi:UPAR/Ly6 domain-containing protein CG9338-like [Panulirus ornatus]|uniref:UPAR/Ly6 domain-containing protein CG9338-like n=1 Tax=Panulirus ornatus TaxID=150431 RepID=UPI003A87934B